MTPKVSRIKSLVTAISLFLKTNVEIRLSLGNVIGRDGVAVQQNV